MPHALSDIIGRAMVRKLLRSILAKRLVIQVYSEG